jgi:hypothetical protein
MELQELKAKKDLQRIVLQVLIYLISQKMYLTGRKEVKSCIIETCKPKSGWNSG